MGDSSVSCALSGLTLHGELAVFIPLFRGTRHEKLVGARLIGYGAQPCVLFSPMTLPYKGQLDDYGRFESIDKDENTTLIETALNLSIEDFTQACIDGEKLRRNDEDILGAGCFIHPEVYQRFSKPVTGGKYAGSLWSGTFAGKPHLEAIGCVFVRDVGEHERYRYIYRHPAIPEISFHSDNAFTHVFDDVTGEQLSGFGLNDIQQSLRRGGYRLFPKEDVQKARKTPELPEIYKLKLAEVYEEQKQYTHRFAQRHNLQEKEAENSEPGILSFLRSSLRMDFLFDGVDDDLGDKYTEVFLQGRLLDRLAELQYLISAFSLANRIIMPTITGTQHPEHDTTSVITGFVDKLAKRRVLDQ